MHYCADSIYRLVVIDTKCKVFSLHLVSMEEVDDIKGTVVLSNLCTLCFLILCEHFILKMFLHIPGFCLK